MEATSVIKVADNMAVICNYWRHGLRRSAATKMVKLVAYIVKLLVYHKWGSFLWEYLQYLWTPGKEDLR